MRLFYSFPANFEVLIPVANMTVKEEETKPAEATTKEEKEEEEEEEAADDDDNVDLDSAQSRAHAQFGSRRRRGKKKKMILSDSPSSFFDDFENSLLEQDWNRCGQGSKYLLSSFFEVE